MMEKVCSITLSESVVIPLSGGLEMSTAITSSAPISRQ